MLKLMVRIRLMFAAGEISENNYRVLQQQLINIYLSEVKK